MKKYHYTYLIQHKTKDKRYIGVRSSNIPPIEDTSYWGSSKHLPTNIQEDHVKIILKVHSTREEAIAHEILLHTLNNVVVDESYYNKAKQTSTGFDTTGNRFIFSKQHIENMKAAMQNRTDWKSGWRHTEEAKAKIANSKLGKPLTEEHRQNVSKGLKEYFNKGGMPCMKDKHHTEISKEKLSATRKRKGLAAGINNQAFTPWFISYPNSRTELFYDITKREKSLEDNLPKYTYQDLANSSKGVKPITKGKFKGCLVGNIPVKDIV